MKTFFNDKKLIADAFLNILIKYLFRNVKLKFQRIHEINILEDKILSSIDYNFNFCTIFDLLKILNIIINKTKKYSSVFFIAQLLLEISLLDVDLLIYNKINLATSAWAIAEEIVDNSFKINTKEIGAFFPIDINQIKILNKQMKKSVEKIICEPQNNYIFIKYSNTKYMEVTKKYFS